MTSLTRKLQALPPLDPDLIPSSDFYTERDFSSTEALELIEKWLDFDELHDSEKEQSDRSALIHAWAIVAHFGGDEGLAFLIDELRVYIDFEDDLFIDYFPQFMLARAGENGPSLRSYLKTEAEGEFMLIEIASALAEFAKAGVERDESLKTLAECLTGDPRHRSLKGVIITDLVEITSDKFLPEMRTAFEKNLVDVSVNGDLEDLEVSLGLLESRAAPQSNWSDREEELAAKSRAERLGLAPKDGDHAGTLAYFLRLYESPTSARSLAELDGLLLGAIVSPASVSPTTYLPAIWDSEGRDGDPEWESMDEAQRFLGSVMYWHNQIVHDLDDGSYHPPLKPRSVLDEPTVEEADWARGILKSVMFWGEGAEEPSDAHKAFVACALHITKPTADTPADELIQVGHAIEAARMARANNQSAGPSSHSLPPFVSSERAEPKLGRNDPCLCGSGKKYKRCCMN